MAAKAGFLLTVLLGSVFDLMCQTPTIVTFKLSAGRILVGCIAEESRVV